MTRFHESVASLPATSEGNGIFDVTVISPGWGSSGYYSESMLREFGPKVFTKNRPLFANHASEDEFMNGRDVTKIWAKIHEDARWEDGRVKAKIMVPNAEKREFVENFMETIGLSISVEGESVEGEAEGRTGQIVESLNPNDRYASLDFVVAAGRGGRVEKVVLESFRAAEAADESTHAESSAEAEKRKAGLIMEEQLKALTTVVEALVARYDAAEKRVAEAAEAQAKAEADKVNQFDAFAAVEQVTEAKLVPALHKRVVEAIKGGNRNIEALIADAKEIQGDLDSLRESDENVRVNESASPKAADVASLGIFGGSR